MAHTGRLSVCLPIPQLVAGYNRSATQGTVRAAHQEALIGLIILHHQLPSEYLSNSGLVSLREIERIYVNAETNQPWCLCKAVSKTMRWSGTYKIARTLSVITACGAAVSDVFETILVHECLHHDVYRLLMQSYQGLRLHQEGVPKARLPFPGPCPRPTDIQDPKIVNSFNISKLEGLW